jgi:hypothetical protein
MTLDSESDGVIPLAVRKGELVQIFVQLSVPTQLSGNIVDRLSVVGKFSSGPGQDWAFTVPVIAFATGVTIEFPSFEIHPGETKAVPVGASPGLVPPPSVSLRYAPQGSTQFSIPDITLTFQGGLPATGLDSLR